MDKDETHDEGSTPLEIELTETANDVSEHPKEESAKRFEHEAVVSDEETGETHKDARRAAMKNSKGTVNRFSLQNLAGRAVFTGGRHLLRSDSYIRDLASSVKEDEELLKKRKERLGRAMQEAGEDAHGVVAVEVWIWDDIEGNLVCPEGGFWIDPALRDSSHSAGAALDQLQNVMHEKHSPPQPTSPGVDLVGHLWSIRTSNAPQAQPGRRQNILSSLQQTEVQWISLEAILVDDDLSKSTRTPLLHKAGLRQVAGVPFSVKDQEGYVLFYTKSREISDALQAGPFEEHMIRAAALIAAVLVYHVSQSASTAYNLRVSQLETEGSEKRTDEEENGVTGSGKAVSGKRLMKATKRYLRKFRGRRLRPPPKFTWKESLFTFFGSLSVLLIYQLIRYIVDTTGVTELSGILLGPMGSLAALQYQTTGAPSAQPRMVVYGHIIGGSIATAFVEIPTQVLPLFIRSAIGPAVAIFVMSKLGIVHAPAAATAAVFAAKEHPQWEHLIVVVIATTATIIPALVINNLSSKRQYPTFWKMRPRVAAKTCW